MIALKHTFAFLLVLFSCDIIPARYFESYEYINTGDKVIVPPSTFNSFYKKYLNAGGIPILSSASVADSALIHTRHLVLNMLAKRPEVLGQMVMNRARIGIVADNEKPTDLPEYQELNEPEEINSSAGIGGSINEPFCTFGENDALDRGEGHAREIAVHEIAHLIHNTGLLYLDQDFDQKLENIYNQSIVKGLWKDTYAAFDFYEFWAEVSVVWFGREILNSENSNNSIPNTRSNLKAYDLDMYELLAETYPNTAWRMP